MPGNRLLKRLIDYTIAVPAFILSLPFLLVAAIWIKLVSPGPVLFRQEREGPNGSRINMLKLRTMHLDAERLLAEY